jgi:hypothetical protein
LASSHPNIDGVFLVHSFPWKSRREYKDPAAFAEREEISSIITALDFNKDLGSKFLVMISGDIHMMTYDHGG